MTRGKHVLACLLAVAGGLSLVPPQAGAAVTDKPFYAWGVVVVRSFDQVDDFAFRLRLWGGGHGLPVRPEENLDMPNKIRIDIEGGSPNIERMRDAGLGLAAYTSDAEWRTGITQDCNACRPDTGKGTRIQLIGRVETTVDGGRRFVADIVRPHEFDLAERSVNTAAMTGLPRNYADENGAPMQEQTGVVVDGPLEGWNVTADLECSNGRVDWRAEDGEGNRIAGSYRAIYDRDTVGTFVTHIDSPLVGGAGRYAGATGGARFPAECAPTFATADPAVRAPHPVTPPPLVPLEIDVAAA